MRTYTIHHTHYTLCFAALLLVALLFFPACSDSNEPDSAGQASGAVVPTPVPMTPTLSYLLTDNNTKLVITGTGAMPDYVSNSTPWTEYASGITEVELPEGLTHIGGYAFYSFAIRKITIPSKVAGIGNGAFSHCTQLDSISLPDYLLTIGESAFSLCSNLVQIRLSAHLTKIGKTAFMGCGQLQRVCTNSKTAAWSLPASVTEIGDGAFMQCPKLSYVNISSGSVKIGDMAFSACTGLTSIQLDKVTQLGKMAFLGCTALTTVAPFVSYRM